jgi:hypothetical protein
MRSKRLFVNLQWNTILTKNEVIKLNFKKLMKPMESSEMKKRDTNMIPTELDDEAWVDLDEVVDFEGSLDDKVDLK